jgi:hypothetical protein
MKITQQEVSDTMMNLSGFTFTDNGTYRTYELLTPPGISDKPVKKKPGRPKKKKAPGKTKKASRSKMVAVMQASKGKFITVTFTKKNGKERNMNCQVGNPFMNPSGYINVTEKKNGDTRYRLVNPRTISELKASGKHYIRK